MRVCSAMSRIANGVRVVPLKTRSFLAGPVAVQGISNVNLQLNSGLGENCFV